VKNRMTGVISTLSRLSFGRHESNCNDQSFLVVIRLTHLPLRSNSANPAITFILT
jgi:hypothetical protein